MGSGKSMKSPPGSVKSPPPPQPAQDGDLSPVESIYSSLLSAYGAEDSAENRHSQDTAATQHSFVEPSSPKVLPKDRIEAGHLKLDIVSPFALPTPVSSKMNTNQQAQPQGRHQQCPPTPPEKDDNHSMRPITPKSSKVALPSPPASDNISVVAGQSPTQPQLWRRRSLKAVKPLTVPELKLISSHGSTASTQQLTSTVDNDHSSLPKPVASRMETRSDSPILNGLQDFSGQTIEPSTSQRSLQGNLSAAATMGHKNSRETLDGFSEYAQELEQGMSNGAYEAHQYSPATMSPEYGGPPTPEYEKDETLPGAQAIYSPTSPRSLTPPEDARPLSMIPESPERTVESTTAAAATTPAAPLPALPPRNSSRPSSRPGSSSASAPATAGMPRSASRSPPEGPTVIVSGASLAPSPEIRAAAHGRSTSSVSIPASAAEATDDGDTSTIKAPLSPRPATAAPTQAATVVKMVPPSPTGPQPGDPTYFPMRHYLLNHVERGTVLPAAPLKKSQLECFAGHYRFVTSRNEAHPLACQSCDMRDNGARFTCSHCNVRLCAECMEVLMVNGRDLVKLVEMLRGD